MKKTLLALALAGFATTASADALIYGGANVGQSDLNGETSTSSTVYVGTGLLPILGIEAGYTNLGSFDLSGGVEKDVTTKFIAARPSVDIGPLHIYGRAGLQSWESETTGQPDDDGVDIMYGFGAEYSVMGPFSVGAGYEVYEIDDDSVETFTLNATFHFL
jgi:opacity protein-like surface antigen